VSDSARASVLRQIPFNGQMIGNVHRMPVFKALERMR
jgi:hypothetical protein